MDSPFETFMTVMGCLVFAAFGSLCFVASVELVIRKIKAYYAHTDETDSGRGTF